MQVKSLEPKHSSLVDQAEQKLANQRTQIEVLRSEIDKISALMKSIETKLDTPGRE